MVRLNLFASEQIQAAFYALLTRAVRCPVIHALARRCANALIAAPADCKGRGKRKKRCFRRQVYCSLRLFRQLARKAYPYVKRLETAKLCRYARVNCGLAIGCY
jgi:hypothetical protein